VTSVENLFLIGIIQNVVAVMKKVFLIILVNIRQVLLQFVVAGLLLMVVNVRIKRTTISNTEKWP
jgi:hypothetical protein